MIVFILSGISPSVCVATGPVFAARSGARATLCKMACRWLLPSSCRPAVEPAAFPTLGRGRLARAAPHGSAGEQEGPCAGQEARHQERHRRPAPARNSCPGSTRLTNTAREGFEPQEGKITDRPLQGRAIAKDNPLTPRRCPTGLRFVRAFRWIGV